MLLEECRLHSRVTMMYRTVHGLVAIPLQPNIQWNTRGTRGHSIKFLVPLIQTCLLFQFLSSYSHIVEQLTNWCGTITICALLQELCGSCLAKSLHQLNSAAAFLKCTELITVPPAVFSTVTHMFFAPVHYWQFQFYVSVQCFNLCKIHFLVMLAPWSMHDITH